MTVTDDALDRLLTQIDAGTDCLIEAELAPAERLFARASAALADRASVITVAAPGGELGLSSLIAQVSERPDLNDQDDAVLELGFKRLTAEGRRTVLMVLAPRGIALPALRYLQHVARTAPGLVLVVLASSALDAALAQAGAASLRARLQATPAIVVQGAGEPDLPSFTSLVTSPAGMPAAVPVTSSVTSSGRIPLSSPMARRARLVPWAATAVSVAAASVIVVQLSRAPGLDAPVPSAGPAVTGESVQTSTVVPPAPTTVETVPAAGPAGGSAIEPPPVSFPAPAPVTAPTPAPALPPLVKPDRVLHARRPDPRSRTVARAGRPSPEWRTAGPPMDESSDYSSDDYPPLVRRWAPRWREEQGQDGYDLDRYGAPLYPRGR